MSLNPDLHCYTTASGGTLSSVARQYPLPGIGDGAEVADLMAWLPSPAWQRVTGQIWSIGGAFSAIRPLVRV